MAQQVDYKIVGHRELKKGEIYTVATLPIIPDVTIDTMELVDATLLNGLLIEDNGEIARDTSEKAIYAITNIRGVRMKVIVPDAEYHPNHPNIAGVVEVGSRIIIDPDYSYEVTDGYGVVALGQKVTV